MLLLVTIPIALFFHPSEEFIKQLGSNSPESVSKTQGLKSLGVYTKQWLSCTNTNAFVSFNTHTIFIYSKFNSIAYYSWHTIRFFIHFDTYKGLTSLIAYIPHYTLEMMSFCIFTSGLYMLNKSILRKITNLFRKEKAKLLFQTKFN